MCACDDDWGGGDCSEYSGCAGVNDSAVRVYRRLHTVSKTHATRPPAGSACGYLLEADGSGIAGDFAIGYRLAQSGTALSSHSCDESYVLVVAGGHSSGAAPRRVCRSDLDAQATYGPQLASGGQRSMYVEHGGAAVGDGFAVTFRAVATSCPGTVGMSGAVEDVCGGVGSCVDVAYAQQRRLLPSAKACDCSAPLAASAVGASCDACAFGHDGYPQCAYERRMKRNACDKHSFSHISLIC